jgi:Tfp pilus assembly protein PilV
VIEVLMSITVLAVGAASVMSLQKAAVVANRRARDLNIASAISRTWIERLRSDAMLWNHPSSVNPVSDLNTDTTWLKDHVSDPDPDESAWFRPTDDSICGMHDVFGRDELCTDNTGPYCVNLRLSWVREQQNMIRAEVRVYWVARNEGEDALPPDELPCGDLDEPPAVDDLAKKGIFHVVHATTAVTKNQAH